MKEKNIEEVSENNKALMKVGLRTRIRLKLRQYKREVKDGFINLKNADKKELVTNIFSSRYFIVWLFFIILLKTILFSADTVFYKSGIWLWYIRQTAFFIIVMVSPLFLLRSSRLRFTLGMILNLLISILLWADEMYFSYASNIISVMQAGNLQYKDEIIAAIPSLLHIRQIFYFIDFPIIFGLLISKKIKIIKHKEFKLKPVLFMAVIVGILCSYYHFIPESIELVTGFIYNKTNSVRYGTIYGYHFVDIKNAITHNNNTVYKTYDEMVDVYKDFKQTQNELNPENTQYVGIAEDKNVIVLQLESVQEFVVGATINGKEITPNLNEFLEENISVTNMHSTSYTTTADSEHSVITSTYPQENGEAFSKYYGNTYDDIFENFKNSGYYTMYAHGNHGYFWNRQNVFSKLSVDNIKFLGDFEDESELIRTYLSDELLYKQTVGYMKEAVDSGETVFYDLVAASSHKPFELAGIIDKYSKVSIDVEDLSGTELGNYLEAVNYADYAFGIFIDELKEAGLYDNTVIIVFGDHYGMQMYDEDLIEFLGYSPNHYNDAEMQYEFSNVLCGIRIPGISNVVIDEPVSKLDVKPTLAQICNIEDTFSLGTSIFNRNSYAAVNNGKIITKDYYYDADSWYVLETGEKLDMNSLSQEEKDLLDLYVDEALTEIEISNSVVVNNLLQDVE